MPRRVRDLTPRMVRRRRFGGAVASTRWPIATRPVLYDALRPEQVGRDHQRAGTRASFAVRIGPARPESILGVAVIELFQFLERNKDDIVEDLVERIPATVPAFLKVPKPELQQTLEHLLEAYGDYLVTGEPDTLTSVLRYITKVRAQQSFKLSDVLRALLLLTPAIRGRLQDEFRDDASADARERFNSAMEKFEETSYDALCLFVDIFQEYLMSMINEHQDYLKKTNQKFGVDLSKFILFKG